MATRSYELTHEQVLEICQALKFHADLGFPIAGQAMGYGECLTKMLSQNDQYEIAEWYTGAGEGVPTD
jgi:hypothetical protein